MFRPDKKCPPVKDCDVKNFVVAGKRVQVKNPRHLKQLQRQAAELEKQAKLRRKQEAAEKKNKGGGWPNAGKYDPAKGKARGK
jgi:hypothetical protein